ncbi:secondary thiamine-phosphate synthase enzyme [Candidatus Velamenicoccus archaeovorus]|uniref:Secondary thiamine-phosphate synthase enzyme n=1 Tax=Velamenicoccus archaeovorus TaxID=1930593 RepID=A0A410P6A6_VELA1|nr:secondary thiamine-phosphate synthase enzyme YjbQ [Candidatus Velamenicoccus archaeovorus]QAT17690.1 secondary thiamine-phosphate synthase enzyme [Candidatus Velamenicoccus archaeovorus]
MKIFSQELTYQTKGHCDIVDISSDVSGVVARSGLKEGMVFVFVVGSTAGLTTCEYEPGLEQDIRVFFEKLIPEKKGYHHDATWGDANGFSHLRASLLKPSLAVPFLKGRLASGTWQQIVLVDFDNRPRERKIIVQLQGES